ncbi:hypothetical protein OU682_00020 [Paracoccus sp. EF6]|uniref:Secreted protein n=1 Tax=Paracoccus benzoatiresistens TaxID=2997341 RepID=A0ABT4IYQ4_9RHOB|nr:hypothetical protein [Paracoccus sp. EF6]MCZ0959998.1 hypothetical protein [Paracoccus sp. EF6]
MWISFVAKSSAVNGLRVLMELRIALFRLSMALVARATFRIAGPKARNGITSARARHQAGVIEADFAVPFSTMVSSSAASLSVHGALQIRRRSAVTALREIWARVGDA